MPAAFADIAFTPPAAKRRSAAAALAKPTLASRRWTNGGSEFAQRDGTFIAERDGFYQATVSETRWPYIRHRDGPPGFLWVLDAQTVGYADSVAIRSI
jgi:uncharacterized protein